MSTNEYTSFFEEIQEKFNLELMWFLPIGFPTAMMLIHLRPRVISHVCDCGCRCMYVHEHDERTIKGGTIQGVPIIFEMETIRYKCGRCGKTFFEKYDCIVERRPMTTDAENYIIWQLGSEPMSQIAEETGVSVQTIANRAIAFGKSEKETMLKGRYTYLSMDEIYNTRDENDNQVYYWVLNDISVSWKANNIMLEMGRTKDEVIKRLMQLENRDKVKAVSIDMWEQYRDAIIAVFPNAAIVVDRFHVIKKAEERMNDVRKRVNCSKKDKDAMKQDAKLFLKSFDKLSNSELERLEVYLKLDLQLESMYYITQELLEFYYTRGYDEALEFLCGWESKVLASGVPEAISLYNTVYNWLPYILNFFCFRITNGKTEGKNNLIRQIRSMGFYYGLPVLQGCLYAHDRRQEYVKWKKHQKRAEKAKSRIILEKSAKTRRIKNECQKDIKSAA